MKALALAFILLASNVVAGVCNSNTTAMYIYLGGNANEVCGSGSGYNLATAGTVTYQGTPIPLPGQALFSAGVFTDSNYLSTTGGTLLTAISSQTVWWTEGWINGTSYPSSDNIAWCFSDGASYRIDILSSTQVAFQAKGGGFILGGTAPTGTWVNIAMTYDGTTLRGWVGGVNVVSAGQSCSTGTVGQVRIGRDIVLGGLPFNGYVSKIRFGVGSLPASFPTTDPPSGSVRGLKLNKMLRLKQ